MAHSIPTVILSERSESKNLFAIWRYFDYGYADRLRLSVAD